MLYPFCLTCWRPVVSRKRSEDAFATLTLERLFDQSDKNALSVRQLWWTMSTWESIHIAVSHGRCWYFVKWCRLCCYWHVSVHYELTLQFDWPVSVKTCVQAFHIIFCKIKMSISHGMCSFCYNTCARISKFTIVIILKGVIFIRWNTVFACMTSRQKFTIAWICNLIGGARVKCKWLCSTYMFLRVW